MNLKALMMLLLVLVLAVGLAPYSSATQTTEAKAMGKITSEKGVETQAYSASGLDKNVFREFDLNTSQPTGRLFLVEETKDPRKLGNTLTFWELDEDRSPLWSEFEIEIKLAGKGVTLYGYRELTSPQRANVVIPKGIVISNRKPMQRTERYLGYSQKEVRSVGFCQTSFESTSEYVLFMWDFNGDRVGYGLTLRTGKSAIMIGKYAYFEP
jgi:hypothetical protein